MGMKNLGITIRMGAAGHTLTSPEGRIDLRALDRNQLGQAASILSEAMGLETPPIRRQRRTRLQKKD